ncbi:biotin transporter BioY [Microtetraspora sp. NBRC 16547]|uniref:biotin transporter BioY n=1 Tax=Microtetraspora sp. NBRC 16547 TaxID=3030993 RepID=UPI0024A528A1|nr:biotin transporter BioY [Microtetraspora sp. NBRC 16547]GLW98501.1 biotin biosynthesis protein BioY [Microtetraspora sp. NBRC 16547]
MRPDQSDNHADSPQTPSGRRLPARDLALIAVFAGLIAALGLAPPVYLFGGSVPITLQTLGVMLAGSVLGARRGFLACLVFLALVAIGLPLLSGGRGGLGVFAGPSAGYLVGWPLGAFVTGWIVERSRRYSIPVGLLANVVGGVLVVYALGIPVQSWRISTSTFVGTLIAAAVYLPGDLTKAVVSTLVTRGVRRALPTPAGPGRTGSDRT